MASQTSRACSSTVAAAKSAAGQWHVQYNYLGVPGLVFVDTMLTESEEQSALHSVYFKQLHSAPAAADGATTSSSSSSSRKRKQPATNESSAAASEDAVPSPSANDEVERTWNTELSRRVLHFGHRYVYGVPPRSKTAAPNVGVEPLPDFASAIAAKFVSVLTEDARRLVDSLPPVTQPVATSCVSSAATASHVLHVLNSNNRSHPRVFDQLIINEYTAGQGIAPHVDKTTQFDDGIVSISLGSSCVMEFSHCQNNHAAAASAMVCSSSKETSVSVFLPARSAIALFGPARYDFAHAIPKRKSDPVQGGGVKRMRGTRVSLTFRKMKS